MFLVLWVSRILCIVCAQHSYIHGRKEWYLQIEYYGGITKHPHVTEGASKIIMGQTVIHVAAKKGWGRGNFIFSPRCLKYILSPVTVFIFTCSDVIVVGYCNTYRFFFRVTPGVECTFPSLYSHRVLRLRVNVHTLRTV